MIGCLSISAQALFLRVAFHRKKVYNKTEIVTIFPVGKSGTKRTGGKPDEKGAVCGYGGENPYYAVPPAIPENVPAGWLGNGGGLPK